MVSAYVCTIQVVKCKFSSITPTNTKAYVWISKNETDLKTATAKGPVAVSINVQKSFMTYKSGSQLGLTLLLIIL
jgi:hypothetical protein